MRACHGTPSFVITQRGQERTGEDRRGWERMKEDDNPKVIANNSHFSPPAIEK